MVNVIEPIFERRFIFDSYACRVGKSTHRALDRCTDFVRRNRFVLQCDVAKFFPTIDHAILLAILGRIIADPQVLRLCERIVCSGEGVLDSERGVPGAVWMASKASRPPVASQARQRPTVVRGTPRRAAPSCRSCAWPGARRYSIWRRGFVRPSRSCWRRSVRSSTVSVMGEMGVRIGDTPRRFNGWQEYPKPVHNTRSEFI
ncbi:MAG: hypothetical protein SNJ69_16250 [Chloroflexaceae bacterium]